jgi:hypothetical protein
MNTIMKFTLPALVVGVVFAAANFAGAQQPTTQGHLVGTWILVSETAHEGDKTSEPLGSNPVGSIMFDQGGRFMLLIARSALPKFAANKRDAGTPEENKAVLAGLLAFIRTYSVSEVDQVLTLHVEASTFPNWVLGPRPALRSALHLRGFLLTEPVLSYKRNETLTKRASKSF